MPLTRDDIRESVERAGDEHWDALRHHHEDAYPNPKPTPGDVCKAEAERLNQLGLGDAKDFELLETRVERVEGGTEVRLTHVFKYKPLGGVEMRLRRVLPSADAGHARAHLARGVGHGPDYRSRCREEILDEARRDGGGDRDHELRRGHVRADLLEQLPNVLWLDSDD